MTALLAAVLVLIQGISGAYVWRLLVRDRRTSWLELAGLGLAVGTALAVLAGCLGFLLPVGSPLRAWMWALPTVAAALVWAWRRFQHRAVAPLGRLDGVETVGAIIGVGLGLIVFLANIANYPLTGEGDWTRYHQDMVFFEGLASGTSLFNPTDSIYMAGEGIRYHWLTYAWVGQLSSAIGAEPFFVLTRVLPLVALVGTVLIAVAWARRLSPARWVPSLAAVLIVTGGYVGAIYGAILNFDSPSQALTSMWLLALLVGLLVALHGGFLVAWFAFALAMSVVVAGGKFSTIVVAAGGFGLLTVVGLGRRAEWRWRAVWLSGAGVLGIVITYVLMVSGSAQAGGLGLWSLMDRASSVQGLNPGPPPVGVWVGIGLLVIAIAGRWAGLGWLLARPEWRGRPETIVGVGLAIVGVLTIALVSGGFNDMWFALAASAPLAVLSAVGLGEFAGYLDERCGPRIVSRWLFLATAMAIVGAVSVAVVWGTGSAATGEARWAAPLLALGIAMLGGVVLARMVVGLGVPLAMGTFGFALVVLVVMSATARPLYLAVDRIMQPKVPPFDQELFAPVSPFVEARDTENLTVITPGQREAGRVLRDSSLTTDVVATNVTNSPLVAALGDRRTYMSGIHYQAPYGSPSALEDILIREAESWDFVDGPSPTTIEPLCEAGVRWVWVSLPRTAQMNWEPWGETVLENEDVALVRLREDACSG